MARYLIALFSLALVVLIPGVPLAIEPYGSSKDSARKYDLKYKFTAGEVVRWKVVHRATVSTTIQGNQQTAQTRSISTKSWRVTAAGPEEKFTFIHSVDDVDMWNKIQGRQEVSYNSRTDRQPPPGYEDVAKGVGVPLTEMTIDARGSTLSREEKHPQPNNPQDQMTPPLPVEPVAVGHTWSLPHEVTIKTGENAKKPVQTRQQFTLSKVEGDIAEIGVETQILTPNVEPSVEAQLVQRLWNGTIRFDMAAGRIVAQSHSIDRRVVGFSGPASAMHYKMEQTEELLPATPETARRPATKK